MGHSVHSEAYKDLLAVLIAAREEANLTQAELGQRLGATQSFISKCERGERRLDVVEFVEFVRAMNADPSAVFARFIARAFGRP
ncbi:helix-turn-helix domain-containing protein [Methylosinus sp. Ce-a6]|uniref:helix-turn-helix domain-containing protein n=1 Tax=Methylosinus sp. Ce-a6 TaxID=2172005 RepID=UPI0013599AA3|nr:helix-turn-helix transcriptional regulator [Methylosinus sp. Ce-a6]